MAALNQAKDFSTVVLVLPSKFRTAPDIVKKALAEISSNDIPKVVITDAATSKVYASNGYTSMRSKDFDSLWRSAKKTLKEDGKIAQEAAQAAAEEAAYKTWTSTGGNSMEARLHSVRGDQVSLVTREGKVLSLSTAQLDDASQKQLNE